MESPPDLDAPSQAPGPTASPQQRRLHYRQKLPTLVYVNLNHSNGGIIRDLSEAGAAIQAVSPLRVDQPVHLRFELLHPRVRVETEGRVAWADARGQGGVEFRNLAERARRLIKRWIFTQLLARAEQAHANADLVLSMPGEEPKALQFSASPRAAIRLQPAAASISRDSGDRAAKLQLPWCPFPISPDIFSRSVDGLILLAAVLLFSVLAVLITETVPLWPVAVFLLLVAASLFAGAYWFLFAVWMKETPGAWLARKARAEMEEMSEGDRPRFR
jgi:hypothetical protein